MAQKLKSSGTNSKAVLAAYIGVGSNLGDRVTLIIRAITGIDQISGVKLTDISGLYETAPVGPVEQPDFLNAVLRVEFEMLPSVFLLYLQDLERKLGRGDTPGVATVRGSTCAWGAGNWMPMAKALMATAMAKIVSRTTERMM